MKISILACILLLVAALTAPASADPIGAISFTGNGSGGGSGGYTPGWKFVPTQDITVTALGFYVQQDLYSPPQTGPVLQGSHNVRIWQAGNSTTPIVDAVVDATTSPVMDSSGYMYKSVTPVTLTAGTTYYLMASIMCPAGSTWYDTNGTGPFTLDNNTLMDRMLSTMPGLTYGTEVGYQNGVYNNSNGTGTALYPDGFDGSPGYYITGTFQYEVPEPCTLAVLAMGSLAAFLRRRNK